MLYVSPHLSLEFWTRLIGRLSTEFTEKTARLDTILQPIPATVDTFGLVMEQTERLRLDALGLLSELEQLQILAQGIENQVRDVAHEAGIYMLERRIASVRALADVYSRLCGLPRRALSEGDMSLAVQQFASLKSSGQSEALNAERARLRAITRELRVMGAEEGESFEMLTRNLQTKIDQLESQLQSLKVSTTLSLSVPEELCDFLARFGVTCESADVAANESAPGEGQVPQQAATGPSEGLSEDTAGVPEPAAVST